MIPDTVWTQRADNRHRDPDDPRKDHCDYADLRGQRTAARDHLGNVFRTEERPTEVTPGNVLDPMQILHEKWIAQPELRHIMCSLRLAELGEALGAEDGNQRVSREDPQHDEHDDRYACDGQRTKGETTDNIAVHGRGAQFSGGLGATPSECAVSGDVLQRDRDNF